MIPKRRDFFTAVAERVKSGAARKYGGPTLSAEERAKLKMDKQDRHGT